MSLSINAGSTGLTIYAVIRNGTTAYKPGTDNFATYTTSRDDFDVPLSEVGSTGLYTADFPGGAGYRTVEYYMQVGGSPSHDNDVLLLDPEKIYFDGANATLAPPPVTRVVTQLPASSVSDTRLYAYQNGAVILDPFEIVHPVSGDPVQLEGHTIKFAVWKESPQELLFQSEECSVSEGDTPGIKNVVTVPAIDDAHTGTAGIFRFNLWDETDDRPLRRGVFEIVKEVPPTFS